MSIVFIAMSAYEMGQAVGLFALGVLGAALVVKGLQRWRTAASTPTAVTTSLPVSPTIPAPPLARGASNADDFFFSGVPAPSTTQAGTPAGHNPVIGDTRFHPDYTAPAKTQATPEWTSILMLVIGAGLVMTTLWQGSVLFLAPGRSIEMPAELLGMERLDPDSEISRQVDASWDQLPALPGGAELESAVYTSGQRMILVAAGEAAPESQAERDDLFRGMEEGISENLPGLETTEVDPGALGGQLRCTESATEGVGICAWADDETVGFILISAAGLEIAPTAQQVREAVEH